MEQVELCCNCLKDKHLTCSTSLFHRLVPAGENSNTEKCFLLKRGQGWTYRFLHFSTRARGGSFERLRKGEAVFGTEGRELAPDTKAEDVAAFDINANLLAHAFGDGINTFGDILGLASADGS